MTDGAWQRMLSGRRLDLLNPSPVDIEIDDIAHGLARVARWNGQTSGDYAFSVAQHCLLVADMAAAIPAKTLGLPPATLRLAALLHDGPEYVIGDLISPFKKAVGFDYRGFEDRLMQTIHIRFGLPATLPEAAKAHLKKADNIAAWLEATQLAGFSVEEAHKIFGRYPLKTAPILIPKAPPQAKQEYVNAIEKSLRDHDLLRAQNRLGSL
jgi:5'-deoxynucleotidase YfbR-like HD superfamily hydrolase